MKRRNLAGCLIAQEEESREVGRELGGWAGRDWRDGSLGKPKLVGFTRFKICELVPTRWIINPQSVAGIKRCNDDKTRRSCERTSACASQVEVGGINNGAEDCRS